MALLWEPWAMPAALHPFLGSFWNETQHISVQCAWAVLSNAMVPFLGLGLWGECWGSVVTELQDGSTLFWDRQRRGEGGGHVRCWGVLA